MLVTEEMNWGPEDFAFAAVMLGLVGLVFEFAARRTGNAYRAALAVAVAMAFALVWGNLAVGILGTEDDPANLVFFAVLAVGALGALLARFRAQGMARALAVAALAQVLACVIALAAGWGAGHPTWPWGFLLGTAAVTGVWLLSAWLFHRASREEPAHP